MRDLTLFQYFPPTQVIRTNKIKKFKVMKYFVYEKRKSKFSAGISSRQKLVF